MEQLQNDSLDSVDNGNTTFSPPSEPMGIPVFEKTHKNRTQTNFMRSYVTTRRNPVSPDLSASKKESEGKWSRTSPSRMWDRYGNEIFLYKP